MSQTSAAGGLVIEGAVKIVFHPNFKHETPQSKDLAVTFFIAR